MKPAHSIFLSGSLAILWLLTRAAVPAQTNRVLPAPPTPPVPVLKSPVDSFRTLLVMPSAERRAQLASRPPEVRQKLLDKVQEYQALSPEERELRLKATELRWYLQPLMRSPATNRPAQLEMIPDSLRDLVAVRITQWDKMPPAIQQMMLTNQVGPNYLVSGSPTNMPPLPMAKIRGKLQERFNQLFELTPAEADKVLATLSEAERRQMEKTLAAFEKLTPAQRQQCVVSFSRFASLDGGEQQEFLKNAERWAQMTPAERQSWRELVSNAPRLPPLPELTRKLQSLPRPPHKPAGTPSTNGG